MPVKINCLEGVTLTNPCPICPGMDVDFTGLELVYTPSHKVYITAPYTLTFRGNSVRISETSSGLKFTVKLNETAYRTLAELRDALRCGLGGGGGGATTISGSESDGTLSITVNGQNLQVNIAQKPVVDTVDPTVTDDTNANHKVGRLWLNTTDETVWIAFDVTAGAAVWERIDSPKFNAAASSPSAGDDSNDGYEVGSVWVNTASSLVFYCISASLGAAVWVPVTGVLHNTAATDPTVNDDSGDGYSISSIWYNTVSKDVFVAVDVTLAAAVWVKIDKRLYAVSATAPDVNDDDSAGYEFGSLIYQSSNGIVWFCVSATTGAASWIQLNKLNNSAAASDPAVTDDEGDGYSLGSIWHRQDNNNVWVLVDPSAGAAVWVSLTSGSGGKFVYTSSIALITATDLGVTASQDDANGIITITVPEGVDLHSVVIQGGTTETDANDDYRIKVDYAGTRNFNNSASDMRPGYVLIWNIGTIGSGGPTTGLPFVQDGDNTPQRQIVDVGGGSSSITYKIIDLSVTYSDWLVTLLTA